MKKTILTVLTLGALASFAAAPKAKPVKLDPVAEGYPVWQGAVDKNYLWGRFLCPSDLRQKVVILIEVDASLNVQGTFAQLPKLYHQATVDREVQDWASLENIKRDVLCVISNRGPAKDRDNLLKALSYKGDNRDIKQALAYLRPMTTGYDGLYLVNAPEGEDKFPRVTVMGPDSKEPLFRGDCDATGIAAAAKAVGEGRKLLNAKENKWVPYYGFLPETSKYYAMIQKHLAGKPKPMTPLSKAILKDVVSKDPEVAKEAQIAFDAIEQARSDLVFRIMQEAMACPHRAQYDLSKIMKMWPAEKKKFDAVMAKVKQIPEANALTPLFMKMATWAEPNFVPKNEGEVKKIIAELNKIKKTLEKLKESKSLVVQNGALMMDAKCDELITDMPSRVPEK